MKKILLVSDNPILSKYILEHITPNITGFVFELCFSSVNKNPEKMKELGAKIIDLKKKDADFARNYTVIFSIHCKQIFPKEIVDNTLCVNVHPGLNPYNRGWYPQVFSIINKLPIGATIHIMNDEVDAGNIIVQEAVKIENFDTSLEVYDKVQELEKKLLKQYFSRIIEDDFNSKEAHHEGNYNSISDFKKLCKLDLNHVGTLSEHLDLLRALTHGGFKNAYIETDEGRTYVSISFS